MFELFAHRYPINLGLKVWTERRFREICGLLGAARVRSVSVIEPSPELFPRSGSSEDRMTELFGMVCRWMEVVPDSLHLRIVDAVNCVESFAISEFSVDQRVDATGCFYSIPEFNQEPAELLITSRFDIGNESMLATMARGVAQHVLRTRMPRLFDAADHAQIADLLPVFFGLGIFAANSTLRVTHGTIQTNKMLPQAGSYYLYSRMGHLSAEAYGYANALFAWVRNETRPSWSSCLRLDSRETMNISLKFLDRTSDCIFESDVLEQSQWKDSLDTLELMLQGRMPTWQVYALMELKTRPDDSRRMIDWIIPLALSRNPDVKVLAIQTLAMSLPENEAALEAILKSVRDRRTQVRLAVAASLCPGSADDRACLKTLVTLCADPDPVVSVAAADRLLEFPDLTSELMQPALDLLRAGDIRCNSSMMYQALQLLHRIRDDVPGLLSSEFDASSIAAILALTADIPGIELSDQDQVIPADWYEPPEKIDDDSDWQ